MKKLDKADLMCIFISFHPLLDLLTAIMTRFEVGFVSIGVIVRSIFLFIILLYLFFYNDGKYKNKSKLYVFLLMLFCIFYFITKIELLTNMTFFIDEAIYLFKYLYFPIVFVGLINFCIQYKVDKRKVINCFIISLVLYAILLIVPFLTNTGFNSYQGGDGYTGVVGWFYSANEISAIITMLFPLLFLYIDKRIDLRIVGIFILTIFSAILIGTKLAFFSSIITILVVLIYYLFNYKKYNWKNYLLVGIFLLILALFSSDLPVIKNIKNSIDIYNERTKVAIIKPESIETKANNDLVVAMASTNNIVSTSSKEPKKKTVEDTTTIILSSRNRLVERLYHIYKNRPTVEKLFGVGFSNRTNLNNPHIERNVEMDFFEVFLRYGIVGFILYISLFIYVGFKIIIYLFKSRFSLNIEKLTFILTIGYGFSTAFLAGHVFGSPPVSIYLAFMCVFGLDTFSVKKVKKVNRDKVTFLCLHLGVGGIERATVNTANALAKEKDVTIISFYKLSDEKYYDINPKIKIKYIYYGKPNRQEFIESLKGMNNESFIKNSFIAIKILFMKRFCMIKEIKKIKEGIIISTRVEFSVLLNCYGNDNVIKVAQEHVYHNNDRKYLNQLKYGYGNIDYLIILTERLRIDYEKMFENHPKIKILIIQNMLSTITRKVSKLSNKKIVCVSRLHSGKRINEIIDIANELKDCGWTFDIIGDGEEKEKLEHQIKKLKLEKTVRLLGFLSNEKVIKYLSESSIFVMASISEGFAIVLVEALSAGLPVVAYETDNGVSDVVDDGKEGYIVKNRNKKEYVEKLKYLMDNVEERQKLGKNALKKANLYSNETISKKWIDFIDSTILK